MANNKISEWIERLRNNKTLSAQADVLIPRLEAKQAELGDGATEVQVEQALKECFSAYFGERIGLLDDDALSEEEQRFMDESAATVKSFFKELNWSYDELNSVPGNVAYIMGLTVQGNVTLRILVQISALLQVCTINILFPISTDKTYDYLICKAIAGENYLVRYGALQYDATDGEVSYRYSYPITHGLYMDDFRIIFLAMVNSANNFYAEIKKHCIGKYNKKEVNEIFKKIEALVNGLSGVDE